MSEVRKVICETPIKPGEQVHCLIVQVDEEGNNIGEAEWSAYGFTNAQANEFFTGMVNVLNEYARKLNEEKNPGETELMKKRRDTLKR